MWDLIVSVPDHCLSFYFVARRSARDRLVARSSAREGHVVSSAREGLVARSLAREGFIASSAIEGLVARRSA